jgi:divalent metal cation (Fe/Co/Zn/Cd) transporter
LWQAKKFIQQLIFNTAEFCDMLNKRKLASSEGWISIVIYIVLFGIKYWAGIVSGSIAFITAASHSLSDSISSPAIIIGSKVAANPSDKRHLFGHGRAELITAILIGMMLVRNAGILIGKIAEKVYENYGF